MQREIRPSRVGRTACALLLSCVLSTTIFMDGASAQLAYAANGPVTGAQTTQNTATGGGQAGASAQAQPQVPDGESAANPNQPTDGEGEGAAENSADSGAENPAQLSEKVPLEQATSGAPATGLAPGSASGDASAALTPSGQIAGKVTLAGDDAPAVAGIIVRDGLKYEVLANGTDVKLVGAASAAPAGDIVVPSTVTSGNDTFAVVAVGSRALAACADATSVTLPASVRDVAPDAFDGCPSLASIEVASTSEHFSSHDGLLFDKAGAKLVRCPEGKRGVAVLPATATEVSPQAFAGCAGVASVAVTSNDGEKGKGSESDEGAAAGVTAVAAEGEPAGSTAPTPAFATFGGALYTGDLTTLVFCPAGIGAAVVLPAETEVIGPQALAGCANLASVTALGTVRTIDPTAFADETKAAATVALPAGEDYAARKAVWEAADFQHFAEPAQPGATARPETTDSEAPASGLAFTLLDDYTLAVAWEGAEDPAASLEIPASAEINGVSYRVSTIAPNAFANRATLETVKLPATVITISKAAFAGCANLASVELPAALQVIAERAFEATALTDMWLPATIATIGPRAFANCEALTRIVALNTPEVADDALAVCTNLSVYCPYNAEGTYPWNLGLLANNNHLMPYGLTLPAEPLTLEVGQQANLFEGALCESPEPTDLTFSYAATPLSVDQTAQVTAKAPGTSEVTATLTLDAQELARATRTVEVTTPPIMLLAAPATGATEVVDGDLTYALLDDGTLGVKATDSLTIEEALIPSKHAYPDHGSLPVTQILPRGFVGPGVNSGEESKLTKVVLPDTITELGEQAFDGCGSLVTITLPSQVSAIGNHALRNCFTMTSIEVAPDNKIFSSIDGVLYNKEATTLVRMPQGRTGTFTVPASVTTIGKTAFYGSPITAVDLPETLQTIADDAFAQCGYLTSVVVPESVTSIGTRAFYNNVSLESAQLPSGLDVISGDLFFDDSKLSSVVMPKAYTELGIRAFGNCTSLTSFTIPESVRIVRTYALQNCTGLKLLDIQTTEVEVVQKAFIGCTNLSVVAAYGTLAGSGMQAAFDEAEKTNVRVILPQTSTAGQTYTQMANAWGTTGFGFQNVCVTGGALPMVNNEGSAEWRFELNPDTPGLGTLTIEQTAAGIIDTLGWAGADMANDTPKTGYWSPLRSSVAKVVMRSFDGGRIHSVDADNWFTSMVELVDVSETHVPLDAVTVDFMYNYCSKLTSVPDDLTLPDTVVSTAAMFRGDPLEHFPEGLRTLSKNIKSVNSMFAGCKFTELPVGFTLEGYEYLDDANWFISGTKLTCLPEGFKIPSNVSVRRMFEQCDRLASLPEGFVVPTPQGTVTDSDGKVANATIEGMFMSCPALTYLPASFDFASLENITGFDELFTWHDKLPAPATTVQTYYAGTLPVSVGPDKWVKRYISDATKGLPAGTSMVDFLVPDDQGQYGSEAACRMLTDAMGKLPADVRPEFRENLLFAGWYIDKECTQAFDFTKSVNEQGGIAPTPVTTLYGKYLASSGELPTTRGGIEGNEASWSLTRDGTLTIRCDVEGAEIKALWFNWTNTDVNYWGPFRDQVKKFVMDSSTKARSMRLWFHRMKNLTDISQAFIPDGTQDVNWLFFGASSLTKLHEGFILPESVKEASGMFQSASSLTRLPDGFTLVNVKSAPWFFLSNTAITELPNGFALPSDMSSVNSLSCMFLGCTQLKALPEGFVIPEPVSSMTMDNMFKNCTSLTSLPEGFTIPEGVNSAENTFENCTSLTTLPEGFSVPGTVTSMNHMFYGCDKLTVLPTSFDFPLGVAKNSEDPFKATTADTLTYYAGENASVKDYPSWGLQNRKLVLANDPTNPLPDNAHLVTFKIPDTSSADGWVTYVTALTNEAGTVANPGDPARFGYSFEGWFANVRCTEPFNFEAMLTQDVTVYGKFSAPILRYEVPLSADVSLYADGSTSPASLQFKSLTPVPVSVKEVSSSLGEGAAALVPQEDQRGKLMANLSAGYEISFPLAGGNVPLSMKIPASTGFFNPSTAGSSLTIDFKGAQVNYSEETYTDVARLTWVVGI